MNFNSIMVGSDDPDRLKEYYTRVLGAPTMEDSSYFGWQIGTGWLTIGPHDQVRGPNSEPGRMIWNIETPDVKEKFAEFQAAGAQVVQEPYQPGGGPEMTIATFADPDGNYFQLMSPVVM